MRSTSLCRVPQAAFRTINQLISLFAQPEASPPFRRVHRREPGLEETEGAEVTRATQRRRAARPLMIALEPRIMFDGAAVAEAAHAAADARALALIPPVAAPVVVREADPSRDNGKMEVAFVDTAVADYKTLEAAISPGVEIVEVGGGQSGLAQMAAWAETHSGYDAIHVLSHGSEGALYLGTDAVTEAGLASATVQAELAEIGHALKAGGDLLIYGCSVGAGETGAAFVADLATLTGADVAASADATGSSARGGNWVLETAAGPVATPSLSFADYDGLLPTTTYDGNLTTGTTYNRPWTPFDIAYAADPNNLNGTSSDTAYAGNQISQTSPTSYNYTVATFVPTASGSFTFAVTAANIAGASWDATDVFMSIYSSNFSSASPLTNLYYANDDTTAGSDFKPTIANISLTAGQSYIVVMTAFDSGVTGSYTFAVTGPSGGAWTSGVVAGPSGPTITSATYSGSSNVLTVTGSGMTTGDSIDATKLTVTGEGGGTYTLAGSYTVTAASATSFTVTLNDTDARNVEGLLNYDGTVSVTSTTYNIAGAASWDASRTTAADLTGNAVTVSNTQNPAITSATYDASTGVLTVTGSDMV
ncbi:MAG: DUF4347 domain-containing protein, partial [Magnetospirillum sp.]